MVLSISLITGTIASRNSHQPDNQQRFGEQRELSPDNFLIQARSPSISTTHVYVTDATTGHVQQFSATGMFLRGWGADAADTVQFGIPRGVAADAQGNVYVSSASSGGGAVYQWSHHQTLSNGETSGRVAISDSS